MSDLHFGLARGAEAPFLLGVDAALKGRSSTRVEIEGCSSGGVFLVGWGFVFWGNRNLGGQECPPYILGLATGAEAPSFWTLTRP